MVVTAGAGEEYPRRKKIVTKKLAARNRIGQDYPKAPDW